MFVYFIGILYFIIYWRFFTLGSNNLEKKKSWRSSLLFELLLCVFMLISVSVHRCIQHHGYISVMQTHTHTHQSWQIQPGHHHIFFLNKSNLSFIACVRLVLVAAFWTFSYVIFQVFFWVCWLFVMPDKLFNFLIHPNDLRALAVHWAKINTCCLVVTLGLWIDVFFPPCSLLALMISCWVITVDVLL